MNVNEIRELLAQKLSLTKNSGHDAIYPKILEIRGENLQELEERFRLEACEYFKIDINSSWDDIVFIYLQNIESTLQTLGSKEERRQFLINELRRLQLAKMLQLVNKFTANFEDIEREFSCILES